MKDLHIPYIVRFYHVFAIKLGLNLGPLAQDTANSLSSNFWCRPALRCWNSWKVWASVGTGDDISLDLPAYFVGTSATFMQVINKSNKKEHHAKYGLHFLSNLISTLYWFRFLFIVFTVTWVEFHKIDLHISIYAFQTGGSAYFSFNLFKFGKSADLCVVNNRRWEAQNKIGLTALGILPHM